jgi:hypothetical protein
VAVDHFSVLASKPWLTRSTGVNPPLKLPQGVHEQRFLGLQILLLNYFRKFPHIYWNKMFRGLLHLPAGCYFYVGNALSTRISVAAAPSYFLRKTFELRFVRAAQPARFHCSKRLFIGAAELSRFPLSAVFISPSTLVASVQGLLATGR